MTLDIKGGLKNSTISSNRYVVVEELLTNAIDSYLIRKESEPSPPSLKVDLEIEFFRTELFEDDSFDVKITCTDNGSGFGEDEIKAFVTKDTSYKDYLGIKGIEACKGVGRIQFFHDFKELDIESRHWEANEPSGVHLHVQEGVREISARDFRETTLDTDFVGTKIELKGLTEEAYAKQFSANGVRSDLSATKIKNHLFAAFMQRFIVLKGLLKDFSLSITEVNDDNSFVTEINASDLPDAAETRKIPLSCTHGTNNGKGQGLLVVSRYSLSAEDYPDFGHEVALCANSALVYSLTSQFIRRPAEKLAAINGQYELLLVESEYLEDKVNEQRDQFNIPAECSETTDFESDFSLEDILESLEDYVFTILEPSDFDREALILSTEQKYGISRGMLNEVSVKVHYNDTEENIAKRVLKKYQDYIVDETSQMLDLKQELLKLDPRDEDFRNRVGDVSWKYTSTIKKVDMASLSQLVVRRSAMLDILRHAIESTLACQDDSSVRRETERIIHNVFFPTGKDSNDSVDHDIWILNEEYHYFEHISSDKSLASIPWDENEKLFHEDIDESLEALFAENNREHRLKRPDIAIFNEEGSAIIIELKAPNVELQEHIPDLVQYARLLAAKSGGRIRKFYGYLIGDTLEESRMPPSYTRFPSGSGYFNTDPIADPATGKQYGELYSEVLFYNQFIDRAEKRLRVFKEKLRMDE